MIEKVRSTTILCVRRNGKVVMAGDGQVTLGQEVLKSSARKLRRLYNGNLPRSVVELAKEWRTDRVLRHLEALLLVADPQSTFLVSGNGDVIEPDNEVASIGSGGPFAKAAATALMENTKLGAKEIAEKAIKIAAESCIYTNQSVTFEELG